VSSLILIERRETLGLLTLNRPEASNPLDRDSAVALLEAFKELFSDDSIRSIALTGAGASFCAGGDLRQMGKISDMDVKDALEWPSAIIELNRLMLSAPKPVVAAVNGPAYAGGMGLAGMCDVVLATPEARFAMPEVRIGLFPMIIVAHLARAIPRKILLEMMLTGNHIDAAEAHRIGFVNRLYPDRASMLEGVDEYGRTFDRVSPEAVRLGRQAFQLLSEMPANQALDLAQFLNLPFFYGLDFQEGTQAFFEKRDPKWIS
jgi:enoyl-CoA hydratase/carnithine racemase